MVPPNGPDLARSTSMWIHWKSPVASANVFTRSCVISSHSLYPRCSPTAAFTLSTPLNTLGSGIASLQVLQDLGRLGDDAVDEFLAGWQVVGHADDLAARQ